VRPTTNSMALFEPTSTTIPPPRKLGHHGLSLWNSVQTAYRIDDVGGIALLAECCAARDRVEALAEALRDELAGRAFIVRTLERLGLNVETIKPMGRPSKGWRGPDGD
jgi:hypothetical protein